MSRAHPSPNRTPRDERHASRDHHVGELVAALTAYPPQTRVQLAVAPGYPQAAMIGAIACSPDDADHGGRPPDADAERVVWIGEGTQLGYLPEMARDALGHSWT